MSQYQKVVILLLRLSTGWLIFYAGVTKIADPNWSAAGYLNNAKTFSGFFEWLASPGLLPVTNFVNEWGLTLLGISLILGLGVRLSSVLGGVLMLLYYFPVLEFPLIPPHSYIVDEHIIYAFALLVLGALNAGRIYGLDKKLPTKFS
ncbi:MAG: DoxX family membrane protein [Candidatus Doudnabacteria bacterium]|nr:DoxX family membrane protein [Candidatus Doudnabacteria bacterium]